MILEHYVRIRVDKIRKFIIENKDKDHLQDLKCKKCKGTGLSNVHYDSDGYWTSWDCVSYCDVCKGIGFLNVKNINNLFFSCGSCNGTGFNEKGSGLGCENCNSTGFVDWIKNILVNT